MSVVSLSMEGAQGVAAAINSLQGSINSLASAQGANTRATAAGARASAQAQAATANLTQTAQQGISRFAGLANQVQTLVGHLGSENRTAGLIGSIASTTASFGAMGASFGPLGTGIGLVVGAIAGMASGLRALETEIDKSAAAERDLRTEVERNADLYAEYEAAIRAVTSARAEESRIELGLGTVTEYGAREAAILDQIEAQDRLVAGMEEAIRANEAAITSLRESGAEYTDTGLSISDMAEEVGRLRGVQREAAAASAELNAQLQAIQDTARRAAAEEEGVLMEDLVEAARPRRGGGAGVTILESEDTQARGPGATTSLDEATRIADMEAIIAARDAAIAADQARIISTNARMEAEHEAAGEKRQAVLDLEREGLAATLELEREHADLMRELGDAAKTAAVDFNTGYVTSIDAVAEAWRDANQAAREAGTSMLSQGRLLDRGLTAIGNNISEVVGGQMTNAFSSAVGAWLDGSKSFVEAAEEMAKGVIKALVQESIVQGVTELARGIADLASYRYDSAALHFAAAAAWAVVGGVAGGIGAATGAFGGGGAKSEGASQRDLADRDRDRQREGSGSPTVVNIYTTGLPLTESDATRATVRGLRSAQRHGVLPAGALGMGR